MVAVPLMVARRPPADGSSESTSAELARVRSGDRDALDRLCARQLAELRRFSRGRMPAAARGAGDTEDLVQDALAGAWARLARFVPRGRGSLQRYLRAAVRN